MAGWEVCIDCGERARREISLAFPFFTLGARGRGVLLGGGASCCALPWRVVLRGFLRANFAARPHHRFCGFLPFHKRPIHTFAHTHTLFHFTITLKNNVGRHISSCAPLFLSLTRSLAFPLPTITYEQLLF